MNLGYVCCRRPRPPPNYKQMVRGDIDALIVAVRGFSLAKRQQALQQKTRRKWQQEQEQEQQGGAWREEGDDEDGAAHDVVTVEQLEEALL